MTFEEYTRHIDWSLTVGRRRTRQTVRQAASTMRELEGAQALFQAEEAVDEPLRMARSPLVGKAVAGIVNAVDREHREVVTTNRIRRRAAGRAIAGRSTSERDHAKGSQVRRVRRDRRVAGRRGGTPGARGRAGPRTGEGGRHQPQ